MPEVRVREAPKALLIKKAWGIAPGIQVLRFEAHLQR